MSQEFRDLPRQSPRPLYGEGEGEADRKRWEDNIRDWTGLELSDTVRRAEEQEEWQMLVARSCGAPTVPKTMG